MRSSVGWLVRFISALAITLVLFILISNVWVISSTQGQVFDTMEQLPANRVGLVLGTTNKLKSGEDNPYFTGRIKAAAELYHRGKIKKIILSGDNRSRYYNEPLRMKNAMLNENVPEKDIILDNAGLRTLDSVIRCKEIFGNDSVTIITQRFHTYRALFISDYYTIKAVALAASDVPFPKSMPTTIREIMARPLAVIDLYILKKSPEYAVIQKEI